MTSKNRIKYIGVLQLSNGREAIIDLVKYISNEMIWHLLSCNLSNKSSDH